MIDKKQVAESLKDCDRSVYKIRKAEMMMALLQDELDFTDSKDEIARIKARINHYKHYIEEKKDVLGVKTLEEEKKDEDRAAYEKALQMERYDRLSPMQKAALLIMDVKFRIPHMTKEITIQPGHTATVWRSYHHHYESEAV